MYIKKQDLDRIINMKSYISAVLLIFLIILAALVYPWKFPNPSNSCPEKPTPEEALASEIKMPAIQGGNAGGPVGNTEVTYRLVRKGVKINKFVDGGISGTEFFQPSSEHTIFYGQKIMNGKNYLVYYPSVYGEIDVESGYGDEVKGTQDQIIVRAQRMLYFVLADQDGQPQVFKGKDQTGSDFDYLLVDFYKLTNGPMYPLKDGALCSNPTKSVQDPRQNRSPDKNQLQLEWFLFGEAYGFKAHCKPAIYLYPKEKTLVNVKVKPKGPFTYLDPPYDENNGWNVVSYPGGSLFTINYEPITKNYLYYEAQIPDSEIKKPSLGWVVEYNQLESLYNDVLPKLGLNNTQTKDFTEYWSKALPKANYYFVGVMDQENINNIEPLEITPQPDFINRVSLYFEALDQPKVIEAPVLTNNYKLKTNNFNVVEWGGLVKLHKNTPFICSQ